MEAVLDANDIFYQKSEVYIESEGVYEVLYEMELGIALGDSFVPMAKKVVAVVQSIVDWFNGLSDGTKRFIADVLVLVTVLSPVLIISGKLTSGINAVVIAFGSIYAQIVTGTGLIGTINEVFWCTFTCINEKQNVRAD